MVKRTLSHIVVLAFLFSTLTGLRFIGGSSGSPAADACTNNASAECTLNATRSTSDADFTAGNVKSGVNILNVTGSYAGATTCSNDASTQCTLSATRSSDDSDFAAGNIKNGVNILNVTGTYTASGIAAETQSETATGTSSEGKIITASASIHTKGSYTQLIASTAFNANRVIVVISGTDGEGGRTYLADLATGAAASESVIVANMPLQLGGCAMCGVTYEWPIPIPSGTRLSARVQSSTGSSSVRMTVVLMGAATSSALYSTVTTYGADTATTRGVSVDPGGTANTEGAYTELSSSTSGACQAELFAFGNQGNAADSTGNYLMDFATGGSGSETNFFSNWPLVENFFVDNLGVQSTPLIYKAINAGTRVTVRSQGSINTATNRLSDVVMFCLN